MSLLPLTMAAVDYDRFHALSGGTVRPEGIDLELVPLEVEEVFYRQVKYAEFDVSEMSLSTYVLNLGRDDFPYVALPVFPSRYFRHQSIFVNERSGITSPQDLRGKKVGVPEYQITASVWQRGILRDDFGVRPEDIEWYTGGVDEPGREEKSRISLPDDVRVQAIGPRDTLSQMLAGGELDALFTAHEPSAFRAHEHVVRLFPDYKAIEKDYFARTGIFPIMHCVVVRRSVLDAHPWVARSLVKAFDASLQVAMRGLLYRSSLKVALPWLADHVEETVEALGPDYWTYGIEANRTVLETFLRYSHEQGLAARRYAPEEIFAPSTASAFTI
ncbi:ABC transporter substrate-binding protein [Georgenia sp. SYP-B2076]|uniref:PhnD/SsuA/transferrin family substrate-binding protein n=1 Tax=Georgenia sp. SYP-B2076 TaxID=2495881 RepID=UPI000F8C9BB9|nr:ABC transporter substrate-binding protein [Georgenia sp. SYP-B2076]